jgi:hypothetical protein
MRITCREASRLISLGQDRDLTFGQRAALRLHLMLCDACTNVKAQFDFLRRALSQYSGTPRDKDDPGTRET